MTDNTDKWLWGRVKIHDHTVRFVEVDNYCPTMLRSNKFTLLMPQQLRTIIVDRSPESVLVAIGQTIKIGVVLQTYPKLDIVYCEMFREWYEDFVKDIRRGFRPKEVWKTEGF